MSSVVQAQQARQLLDSANAIRLKDFQSGLALSEQAFHFAARQKDSSTMAGARLCRGIIYYVRGDYQAAFSNYTEALDYYERARDTVGMINVYAELVIFYKHERKEAQAREAIATGLQLANAVQDTNGLANLNNNAGLFYQSIDQYQSAAQSFRRGLFYYELLQDEVGMSYSLDYLATALSSMGRLEEALYYLKKSRHLRLQTGDKLGESESINNIGEVLMAQHKPDQSLVWFRAARDTALKLHYKDMVAHTWQMESKALAQIGQFQEAYYALKSYQEIREELLNEKKAAALEELQTRYETEKTERENLELQQLNKIQELQISRRNVALLGIAIFVLLAFGLAYLMYNRYRLHQQARLQEQRLQQERLRAEAIVLTEEHERQRLARELHDGVGQMLAAARRSLQFSAAAAGDLTAESAGLQPLVLLDESIAEVRQLSHSMMPPALRNRSLMQALNELATRLGQSSGLTIETDFTGMDTLALQTNQSLMIYRAIQELLGNVIRHAAATEVTVDLVNHGTTLSILVVDNGKGFNPAEAAGGLGLNNIKSRISFLGGTVAWDSQPGQGATCVLEIPVGSG